jgi:biotin carboxyl carrier protein
VESARVRDARASSGANAKDSDSLVVAPMPGKVVKVLVGAGDEVNAGQALIVIEAMKMENELFSPRNGRIAELLVTSGGAVERGAPLIRIE